MPRDQPDLRNLEEDQLLSQILLARDQEEHGPAIGGGKKTAEGTVTATAEEMDEGKTTMAAPIATATAAAATTAAAAATIKIPCTRAEAEAYRVPGDKAMAEEAAVAMTAEMGETAVTAAMAAAAAGTAAAATERDGFGDADNELEWDDHSVNCDKGGDGGGGRGYR